MAACNVTYLNTHLPGEQAQSEKVLLRAGAPILCSASHLALWLLKPVHHPRFVKRNQKKGSECCPLSIVPERRPVSPPTSISEPWHSVPSVVMGYSPPSPIGSWLRLITGKDMGDAWGSRPANKIKTHLVVEDLSPESCTVK